MNLAEKLVKRFNSEDVIIFKDRDGFAEIKSWTHTGSPQLDFNLRTYGYPTGIIELAGQSQSGKTTAGLLGMKYFMEDNPDDGVAVILSSENRDNKDYAMQLGMDVNNIIIIKIQYVELMFMQVKRIIDDTKKLFKEEKIKSEPKFYFMWDSLGATLSKSQFETMEENLLRVDKAYNKGVESEEIEFKNEKMMSFAKEAKQFAKYIMSEMYIHIIHFVIINHQYDHQAPGQFIATKKSTGGTWIELFPTVRLSLIKVKTEKIDDVEVSQITRFKVIKNDFGGRKPTDVRILFGYGIILSDEEIEYAVNKKIIIKEGAKTYSYVNGKLKWSSPRQFFNLYYSQNKLLKTLSKQIQEEYKKDLIKIKENIADGFDDEVED
jgi:RecA/RadA recombinase